LDNLTRTTGATRQVCFAARAAGNESPGFEIRLGSRNSEALAELLPVLICGEESAGLAFAALTGNRELSDRARCSLLQIEADEREHERLLGHVSLALPPPRADAALSRALRRFFVRLGRLGLGPHLTRIVALDSAACVLLGALRAANGAVVADSPLGRVFARIHRDEVRHVLIAREHLRSAAGPINVRAVAMETRMQLVELLTHRAAPLEQVLGVDADRLFARLLKLPRGLFA
jgi:hypothetical protein